MKVWHTILAFVILAALGGTYYALERQPEKPSPDSIPKQAVFSFKPEDVTEFTIEESGQPTATFKRVQASAGNQANNAAQTSPAPQWQIVAPEGIAADSAQIQSFIEELPNFQSTPLASDGAQKPVWSEYGLEPPQRTLTFKLANGQTSSVAIGKENPAGYARYARRDGGDTVLLLDTTDDKSLIEKKLFDLRDKRIIPVDMSQASRIELHFDFGASKASQEEIAKAKQLGLPVRPPRILFVKQPNGNWQLQEPVVRTDFNSTNYLATTIGGGQMNSVEEEKTDSLAKYKLDRPQIRVDVTTPGGVQSLIVGGEKKVGEQQFFYAKNSVWPHIFTILRTVYDQLNQDYEAYRNRYVFDFETASAKRVEILGPTGELRFERKNNKWMRAGSPEKEMEDQKFEGFLDSIHNLRIAAYPTDAPGHFAQYGLEKPWLKIKVTFGEKNQEETVVFGRANKKFYAARVGEPSVYEFSPNEPANLESKLKELAS